MNTFLPSRYTEIVSRLALGVYVDDALGGGPVADPVRVTLDARLRGGSSDRVPALVGHGGGRWSLRYGAATPAQVDVRVFDATRRHVARRLRFTVPDVQAVIDGERHDPPAIVGGRSWRVRLLPGAAYPLTGGATGLRGRVRRDGAAARWARVEAVTTVGGAFAGRASCDDRGEFLLVVPPGVVAGADLPAAVDLDLTARGPDPAPVATAVAGLDPFWDVPLEIPSGAGPEDPVTRGEQLPAAYQPGAVSPPQTVRCTLGRVESCPSTFDLA